MNVVNVFPILTYARGRAAARWRPGKHIHHIHHIHETQQIRGIPAVNVPVNVEMHIHRPQVSPPGWMTCRERPAAGDRATPVTPPTPERATTASSAKNHAVAALTTRPRSRETIMAAATLTATPAQARPALAASAPPPPVILALDLGTTTGWALRSADRTMVSGTVSFRPSRYDGGGMRYVRFRSWLDQLDEDAGPLTSIYFEEVRRHVSTDSAHAYGGFLATLTAWAEQRGIAYQGVSVGTIKRHVTGKGNADKAAVIAAVQAKGFRPADDNEADAIAILLWAIETRGGVR